MKLLIVAATKLEIAPLIETIKPVSTCNSKEFFSIEYGDTLTVSILITGVGVVATTYSLTKHLQTDRYGLVLQAGIAGAYNRDLTLGSLVYVQSEQFGDTGAEDDTMFIDIFDMGLQPRDQYPFSNGKINNGWNVADHITGLPYVSGLTVNTCSGNETTIAKRIEKYGCAIESMEGAAFHYVCAMENVAYLQIRAISNFVTKRNRNTWKIADAIGNLNRWLIQFIEILKINHLTRLP